MNKDTAMSHSNTLVSLIILATLLGASPGGHARRVTAATSEMNSHRELFSATVNIEW